MKKGEIYGTWKVNPHDITEVVIITKQKETGGITVCPISKGGIPYDYTMDIDGRMMHFNTKQLYVLNASDLGSKIGEINEDRLTELSDTCLKSMRLDKI